MISWVGLLSLCSVVLLAESLPPFLDQEEKKPLLIIRPKPKKAQEVLMFGNQQNHQPEANSGTTYTSNTEKRNLPSSGLGGLKVALAKEDPTRSKSSSVRDDFSPYDKNYEFEVEDDVNVLGQKESNAWNDPPYSRYYSNEDRRKKSEKAAIVGTTTTKPATVSYQSPTSTQQSVQPQVKRSVPIYQEPRFKRELDIDPEDVLTLLSLWENKRRNRNWHKYINDEYENLDEDGNLLEEDDPRNVIPWMDSPYPPRHYMDSLSPSDIGIVRTHPPSYYEQFGSQYGQQYEAASQYAGNPQYGLVYPQQTYYNAPEKRFMVSRKRSQTYDPYSSASQYQMSSQARGFPYQHRLVY
ncbi:prohormone-2 isoform X2 [Nomia melanderi]|uniref:prohormone-2 isoform X2 n=1 Tax=Nomia melanderi TaxID=2448451 RepID=UPI00130457D1|nr:prohormone-2-like [Nomia melanderi]XP_031849405.1 prohormone-2-like [Nomia melanderi]